MLGGAQNTRIGAITIANYFFLCSVYVQIFSQIKEKFIFDVRITDLDTVQETSDVLHRL